MDIVIVRHGESEGNAAGRLQGQLDSPLNERGRAQATRLGQWLASIGFRWQRAYASPLRRAFETAELVARAAGGVPPQPEPLLSEIAVGSLEGMTRPEIVARHPEYESRKLHDLGDFGEFGGESYAAVQERVEQTIQLLQAAHRASGDPVLLVAHGGFNLQLIKRLISQPVPRTCFFGLGNCAATRIHLRERRGVYVGEVVWHVPLELMGGA